MSLYLRNVRECQRELLDVYDRCVYVPTLVGAMNKLTHVQGVAARQPDGKFFLIMNRQDTRLDPDE